MTDYNDGSRFGNDTNFSYDDCPIEDFSPAREKFTPPIREKKSTGFLSRMTGQPVTQDDYQLLLLVLVVMIAVMQIRMMMQMEMHYKYSNRPAHYQ